MIDIQYLDDDELWERDLRPTPPSTHVYAVSDCEVLILRAEALNDEIFVPVACPPHRVYRDDPGPHDDPLIITKPAWRIQVTDCLLAPGRVLLCTDPIPQDSFSPQNHAEESDAMGETLRMKIRCIAHEQHEKLIVDDEGAYFRARNQRIRERDRVRPPKRGGRSC